MPKFRISKLFFGEAEISLVCQLKLRNSCKKPFFKIDFMFSLTLHTLPRCCKQIDIKKKHALNKLFSSIFYFYYDITRGRQKSSF